MSESSFESSTSSTHYYVGLDVHQKRSSICILDRDGKQVKRMEVKGSWARGDGRHAPHRRGLAGSGPARFDQGRGRTGYARRVSGFSPPEDHGGVSCTCSSDGGVVGGSPSQSQL